MKKEYNQKGLKGLPGKKETERIKKMEEKSIDLIKKLKDAQYGSNSDKKRKQVLPDPSSWNVY